MRVWDRVVEAAILVAVAVTILMVVLINADVFARTVLGTPIHLAVELTTFGFALTTFLPLVVVAREGREIAFDLIKSRMTGVAEKLLKILFNAAGATAILIIFWPVAKKVVWAYQVGDYIPSSPILYTVVPWAAIAIGLLLYALEQIRQVVVLTRSLFVSPAA
ncbi:MAG: TRAP transporter small permease [Rhizobiaceae bacterium]